MPRNYTRDELQQKLEHLRLTKELEEELRELNTLNR